MSKENSLLRGQNCICRLESPSTTVPQHPETEQTVLTKYLTDRDAAIEPAHLLRVSPVHHTTEVM